MESNTPNRSLIEKKVLIGKHIGNVKDPVVLDGKNSYFCRFSPSFHLLGMSSSWDRGDVIKEVRGAMSEGYSVEFISTQTIGYGNMGVAGPLDPEDESYFRKKLGV